MAGPACAATLRVDSALVVFPSPEPDAAGSIELQARLTDLPIDERRFVRLDVAHGIFARTVRSIGELARDLRDRKSVV